MEIVPLYDDGLYYLKNPCGTNGHPDFLLFLYGRVIPFECKTTSNRRFRFNGTLPHPTTIYAFSDKFHDRTRVALGRDLISRHTGQDIENMLRDEVADLNARLKERAMELDGNPLTFIPYVRGCFDQRGGYANTDLIKLAEEYDWKAGVKVHLLRELRMSKYVPPER